MTPPPDTGKPGHWSRTRLPPRRVPSAYLPPNETQHDPRHPRHPVRRVRRRPGGGNGSTSTPPESAKPATATRRRAHPGGIAGRRGQVVSRGPLAQRRLGLYLWLVVVTGVCRGELCGLQIRDIDLDRALAAHSRTTTSSTAASGSARTPRPIRIAARRSTRRHAPSSRAPRGKIAASLAAIRGRNSRRTAYLFSNHPSNAQPWNPDWARTGSPRPAAAAGRVQHQGRAALHRQPASRRQVRPEQYRRPTRSLRRRRDHAAPPPP